jgi:Na+-driven multidrug efflux pump
MLSKTKNTLSKINYRLFAVLVLMGLLPTIYTTVRIYFLGSLPGDWGYNIASQLAWVNVLYEVVQEAIILPMFFFLGKSLQSRVDFQNKARTGLLLTAVTYTFMALAMILFARPLLVFMAQKQDLVAQTAHYIRLESIALIFATSVKFLTLVLVTMKKDIYLYIVLFVQMILSIILDTFLVSNLKISLNLGVNGIAFTNIIVNAFLLILVIWILRREDIHIFTRGQKLDFSWLKQWLKIGGISGIESLVRNAAFILMVLRLVNVVQEQGSFWVTNSFIWGWLLLRVLALGELIKRDCGESEENIKRNASGYFLLTGIFIVIWLITIPFWKSFIHRVMGVEDFMTIYNLCLVSLAFYIVFALNNVVDSIFYGRGRTDLMLYQSLIVNVIFYGAAFILYSMEIFVPNLTRIAVMFGLGILFDSIITFVMYARFRKRLEA